MTGRKQLLWGALLVTTGLVIFGDDSDSSASAISKGSATATQGQPRRAVNQSGEPPPQVSTDASGVQMLLPRPPLQPLPKVWPERAPRLFAAHTWVTAKAPKAEVAGPPTSPPLPFAYLGMKHEDGVLQVFLVSGDKTHVVRQGDVLGGIYKVESIEPPNMKFMYLPLQQVQILQIGVIE